MTRMRVPSRPYEQLPGKLPDMPTQLQFEEPHESVHRAQPAVGGDRVHVPRVDVEGIP